MDYDKIIGVNKIILKISTLIILSSTYLLPYSYFSENLFT